MTLLEILLVFWLGATSGVFAMALLRFRGDAAPIDDPTDADSYRRHAG